MMNEHQAKIEGACQRVMQGNTRGPGPRTFYAWVQHTKVPDFNSGLRRFHMLNQTTMRLLSMYNRFNPSGWIHGLRKIHLSSRVSTPLPSLVPLVRDFNYWYNETIGPLAPILILPGLCLFMQARKMNYPLGHDLNMHLACENIMSLQCLQPASIGFGLYEAFFFESYLNLSIILEFSYLLFLVISWWSQGSHQYGNAPKLCSIPSRTGWGWMLQLQYSLKSLPYPWILSMPSPACGDIGLKDSNNPCRKSNGGPRFELVQIRRNHEGPHALRETMRFIELSASCTSNWEYEEVIQGRFHKNYTT